MTVLVNGPTKTEVSLSPRVTVDAQVIERWTWGTYIVAGIFAIPSESLTVTEIQRNIPTLYDATRKAKRGWWPRGLCGTFLFPFYIGLAFEPAVIEWVSAAGRIATLSGTSPSSMT